MKTVRAIVLALACATPLVGAQAQQVQAADAARGKQLYDTHCGGCHYERVHDRPRERSVVHSYAELRSQVAQRAALTGRPFTLEDLDDIAAYLNVSHYGFTK
jgi:mono/diheme cytochrome c family protein